MSFGGGGTGAQFCADRRCLMEQQNGVMRGNLIASCSDDGIYLNRAAASTISHNTLIDTAGIAVRFPTSSATIEGNLVDGQIRSRDGGQMHAIDNLDTQTARLFFGSHPLRRLFDPNETANLQSDIPRRAARRGVEVPDLCGAVTGGLRAYGAFADFKGCLR